MMSRKKIRLLSLVFSVVPGLLWAQMSTPPKITVDPDFGLIDNRVAIRATGLGPNEPVTVRATMNDARKREWSSQATFTSDANGAIDLFKQAPISGSYKDIDPMGLLWSMQLGSELPPEQQSPIAFVFDLSQPLMTKFELMSEGKSLASCMLKRLMLDPQIKVSDIREDGVVGQLFLPPGVGPYPGIIVLSGSDGGINRSDAALLSSRGFAAFALAYFKAEGLPENLVEIPLESLKKGIDWFRKHERIDGNKIAVFGGSKGGELGLLLAATFPEIRAVVSYAPSHVVWQGIAGAGPPPDKSSWTYQRSPLPYLRGVPTPTFLGQFAKPQPLRLIDLYEPALTKTEEVEKAAIPVEKINGPVLLISGDADEMWPSAKMGDQIVERLKKHNFTHPYEHMKIAGAGHAIRKGCLPAAGTVHNGRFAFGGTEAANAKAQADTWPRVLRFLRQSLK